MTFSIFMTQLPRRWSILVAPVCLLLAGCSSEPRSETPGLSEQVDQAARMLASKGADHTGPNDMAPVTAEIMEIVDGNGSDWAVAIRFANGISSSCTIDVTNSRSGKLIVRDDVSNKGADYIHETRFQHRGRPDLLSVQVRDSSSGTILTTYP